MIYQQMTKSDIALINSLSSEYEYNESLKPDDFGLPKYVKIDIDVAISKKALLGR